MNRFLKGIKLKIGVKLLQTLSNFSFAIKNLIENIV